MQLLGTGKQRAAKTSRVGVGGVNGTFLTFASWKATASAPDFNTMNFESYNVVAAESFSEGLHGGVEAAISCGGDWDAGLTPFGSPPLFVPNDAVAGLVFFPSRIDAVPWIFTYARIRSAENGGEVGGKVTFNASGFNQGSFTYPTTNV